MFFSFWLFSLYKHPTGLFLPDVFLLRVFVKFLILRNRFWYNTNDGLNEYHALNDYIEKAYTPGKTNSKIKVKRAGGTDKERV